MACPSPGTDSTNTRIAASQRAPIRSLLDVLTHLVGRIDLRHRAFVGAAFGRLGMVPLGQGDPRASEFAGIFAAQLALETLEDE
ncbi:MAG: hypothetical protein JWO26_3382 [Rhodospirillales bacterium]|jgi:hypothetical protein|nr:hypothetical protein [Rhodospirillales bacterium]MDB5383750.1 hypothetical protein [Rhodospirillales bacterium]